MSLEYIRNYYKVPAEIGRRVKFQGKKEGVIVRAIQQYIGVVFDGDHPNNIKPLHPTSEVEYLGIGKVPKMTAGQKRYQDYLDSEFNGTFSDYLGINCL